MKRYTGSYVSLILASAATNAKQLEGWVYPITAPQVHDKGTSFPERYL